MPPDDVLDALSRSPLAWAVVALVGAALGSFANVCILRIPAGLSIVRPGSRCASCTAPIAWRDNLPILSFLARRGRCRSCGARFSPRYLFVEASVLLLSVATWDLCLLLFVDEPFSRRLLRFAIYLAFELVLVVLAFIDLDHKRIPDKITYPGIPAFFLVGRLLPDVSLSGAILGMVAGYGIVRLISDGYYLVTRREGLGYGDGKLLALVGALLGWQAVLFTLWVASLLGGVIGVAVVLKGRRAGASLRHAELPFGPFLVAAAIAYLFVQETIQLAF